MAPITMPFNIRNKETINHRSNHLCHNQRQPWPEFWQHFQYSASIDGLVFRGYYLFSYNPIDRVQPNVVYFRRLLSWEGFGSILNMVRVIDDFHKLEPHEVRKPTVGNHSYS